MIAAAPATTAPCQRACSIPSPTAIATWLCSNSSGSAVMTMPAGTIDQFLDGVELGGCCTLGGKRLHDELRCRAAERPEDEIANQLALCLNGRPGGVIAVRAPPV